jgi:hypothetical protein
MGHLLGVLHGIRRIVAGYDTLRNEIRIYKVQEDVGHFHITVRYLAAIQ